jgi:ferredoxin
MYISEGCAMVKVKRKIIKIDENLCTGCGNCIPACVEQTLQIVETPEGKKARLVKELYCDGLGACLGSCPTGALTIEERASEPFDEEATVARMKEIAPEMVEHVKTPPEVHSPKISGCPSAQMLQWMEELKTPDEMVRIRSELRQWPVQLHLVSPSAPYFRNADLVIVADCVPFAYANFHQDFLKGNAIAVGCPKLDDIDVYKEKIRQIIATAHPKSIKVVRMEVPCCFGLVRIVQQAMEDVGSDVSLETVTISTKGEKLD